MHTPGPLKAEEAIASNYLWEITRLSPRGKRRVVARIASGSENKEADARLFAAAPELLEALDVLSKEEFRDDDDPILIAARVKARAALSKARGQ